MTSESWTAERLRTIYEALAAGNEGPIVEACTDDVVWHIAGSNVISGDHAGPDGVRAILQKLQKFPPSVLTVTQESIAADGPFGHVVTTWAVSRPGAPVYEWRNFELLRFDGERIAEIWTLPASEESANAGLACPTTRAA